jgi:hypothetical protein
MRLILSASLSKSHTFLCLSLLTTMETPSQRRKIEEHRAGEVAVVAASASGCCLYPSTRTQGRPPQGMFLEGKRPASRPAVVKLAS